MKEIEPVSSALNQLFTHCSIMYAVLLVALLEVIPPEELVPKKQEFVKSLQSHFILTMSHWSSGLPVCFPSQGPQVQIPWEVLM
jgi:hypothetical protein